MRIIMTLALLSVALLGFSKENTKTPEMKFWVKEKVSCSYFNSTLKEMSPVEMQVYVKTSQEWYEGFKKLTGDIVEIYWEESIYRHCISLKKDQRMALVNAITKYLEWNDKAIKEGVKLEKDIAKIGSDFLWTYSSTPDWNKDPKGQFMVGFFSQNEKRHQLTLQFKKMISEANEYTTVVPETLYIDVDQAAILLKQLSDEFISQQIETAIKESAKLDSFK